jgi:hypothetical protein
MALKVAASNITYRPVIEADDARPLIGADDTGRCTIII